MPLNVSGFPELPTYAGHWIPVYWTPIMGAKERLTVFMVARGEDGQVCIRNTIRPEFLEIAFPTQAKGILSFFDMVRASLEDWVATPDMEWRSPLSGFEMGAKRPGLADNVRQLAAQGVVTEAAFAPADFADLNQA